MPRFSTLYIREELTRYLYSFVWLLLLPILAVNWLINLTKYNRVIATEYLSRFGISKKNIDKNGYWLHCASVGEVVAAQQLVERLFLLSPDIAITISTNTSTGRDRVAQLFGNRVSHIYLPYDFQPFIYLLLKKIQPRMLLIIEMELWPNLCHCSWKRHIPIYIINGRMSEKSTASYKKLLWLIGPLFKKLSGICVQSVRDMENYIALGAHKDQVVLTNNIKFDLQISDNDIDVASNIKRNFQLEHRTILVAGSTHELEEQLCLDVYKDLVTDYPELLLIIVPRHPQRFDIVSELLNNQAVPFIKLSQKQVCDEQTQVLLADSMGVLRALYSLASIAFVGGSIAPRGGHNALEPAALGVPVLMGKSIYNNPQICHALQQAGALVFIDNQQQFVEQCLLWLGDESNRQLTGSAARIVVEQNRGAIDKTLMALGLL